MPPNTVNVYSGKSTLVLKAGRPVACFELENGGHSLESRDRIAMISELESFLSAHLTKQ